MFRLQAGAKASIKFSASAKLPRRCYNRQNRLRQMVSSICCPPTPSKFTDVWTRHPAVELPQSGRAFRTEDTGIVIHPTSQSACFHPFSAAPSHGRPNAMIGTVLGLTIPKMLAETIGGEIAVNIEHRPGQPAFQVHKLMLAESRGRARAARPINRVWRLTTAPRQTIQRWSMNDRVHRKTLSPRTPRAARLQCDWRSARGLSCARRRASPPEP